MLNWKIEEIVLPLKFDWKISRNTASEKKNLIISVNDSLHSGKGEVAPNIRYGENPDLVKEQFALFVEKQDNEKITDLNELTRNLDALNLCHSLRFGIESAFVHFLCKKQNILPADFFGLKIPEKVYTSFSLPIMERTEIKPFLAGLKRFKSLKIKVNRETALETVKEVVSHTAQPLRIDGNEAWQDVNELLYFIEQIKNFNIEFIEQPLPGGFTEEYRFLKKKSPFALIADESIEDQADFSEISKQFTGINMKLMKAGGYINGLKLLTEARRYGLKTMIGCMIETSLGIFSAYNLAENVDYLDLDGFLIIQADPFNLLKENNGTLFRPLD